MTLPTSPSRTCVTEILSLTDPLKASEAFALLSELSAIDARIRSADAQQVDEADLTCAPEIIHRLNTIISGPALVVDLISAAQAAAIST